MIVRSPARQRESGRTIWLGVAAVAAVLLAVFVYLRVSAPSAGTGIDPAAVSTARDEAAQPAAPSGDTPARTSVTTESAARIQADPAVARVPSEAPADRTRVTGVVVDEAGAPIPDARVEAHSATVAGASRAQQNTDPEGRFVLVVPERTALRVRASAGGFGVAWRNPVFGGEELTLVLGRPARLEVLVKLPDQTPAVGARVRVASRDGDRVSSWRTEVETGADGRVVIENAPRARLSVSASAPPSSGAGARAAAPASTVVDTSDTATLAVELELRPGLRLHGTVLDAAGGAGIPGARVGCDALGHAVTDAAGRYELGGIGASMNAWGIAVRAAGFEPAWRYVRIDDDSGDVELDFRLGPAPRLTGRVVDGRGVGIPGAVVEAEARVPTVAFTGETCSFRAETDPAGRFELAPVPRAARLVLRTSTPTGARAELAVGPFPGAEATIDIGDVRVESTGVVSGDADCATLQNLRDARVVLRPASASGTSRVTAVVALDPWCGFRFEDVVAGSYWLELHASSSTEGSPPLAMREIEVAPGAAVQVDLDASRAWIGGVVLGPDDRPVRKSAVRIVVRDESGRTVARGTLGREGEFRLGVPGDGEHGIDVVDPALRLENEHVERVRPGEDLRIRLRQRVGGGRIEGHLRASDGSSIAELNVAFRDAATLETVSRVAIPDANGRFVMEGFEDAPYLVEVVDFAGRFEPRAAQLVQPDGPTLDILLQRRP